MTREWERWDDPGVSRAIDNAWRANDAEARHRQALADLTARRMSAGESLVEVGCGSGLVLERLRLAMPALDYTGVDCSREMLSIARERLPRERFVEGDIFGLAFPDASFDVAAAFEVLGHLPEIVAPIRELVRVSRKCALFTVWISADSKSGTESMGGSTFLWREFSHGAVMDAIQAAGASADEPETVTGSVRMYSARRR